jgi:hypothetical protein
MTAGRCGLVCCELVACIRAAAIFPTTPYAPGVEPNQKHCGGDEGEPLFRHLPGHSKENCQSFWSIDKIHARQHCSGMKRIWWFVSLAALLTSGCAWYKIQPISADSLNGWGKTNCLAEGYIFYQPELYFLATIVTEFTDPASKQNIMVTPIWLPNYQKPYRVTTHNILAKADFTFNFENGWKLTSIADKGDNSTVANTLASQLTTALKTTGALQMNQTQQQPPKTRVILYRPKFNKNGYFNGFEPVNVLTTE